MAEGKSDSSTTGMGIIIILVVIIGIIDQMTGGSFNLGNAINNERSFVAPSDEEEVSGPGRGTVYSQDGVSAENQKLLGKASDLYGKISLGTGNVWSEDPKDEYMEFYYDKNNKDRILISGMEIKSAISGRGVKIEKGVYRPYFSRVNVEDPIYIEPGDRVYLISGRSPVGYSFRANKCTGYFSQFNNFTPTLENSCPRPNDKKYPYVPLKYRNACYNYIDSLPTCFMPLNNVPDDIGPECTEHVTTEFSYDKCVEENKNDEDFYKNEWYVYLNREEELWLSYRDLIKLSDRNGNTVDFVEY